MIFILYRSINIVNKHEDIAKKNCVSPKSLGVFNGCCGRLPGPWRCSHRRLPGSWQRLHRPQPSGSEQKFWSWGNHQFPLRTNLFLVEFYMISFDFMDCKADLLTPQADEAGGSFSHPKSCHGLGRWCLWCDLLRRRTERIRAASNTQVKT